MTSAGNASLTKGSTALTVPSFSTLVVRYAQPSTSVGLQAVSFGDSFVSTAVASGGFTSSCTAVPASRSLRIPASMIVALSFSIAFVLQSGPVATRFVGVTFVDEDDGIG